MSTIVNNPITLDSAQDNFLLSGVNASTAVQLKASEVEDKKREAKPSRRKSTLMPTGGVAKLSSAAKAAKMAQIKDVIDRMTPEQKIAFVNALNQFQADVAKVREVLAGIKNQNAPSLSDINTVVEAAAAVRKDVDAVLKTAKAAGADSNSSTSIWFVLEQFMVNDVMGMNNLEMSAAMKQVQAQSSAIANVAAGLSKMNTQITEQKTTDTMKSVGFAVGVFLAGLLLAPFTGGLSLAAGIAVAIAIPVCNAQDTAAGVKDTRFDFLSDNSPNTSQMLQDQNNQQAWSLIGTNSNQQLSTTMQLHVQQTSQLNVQAAEQFSTMINYASQTMSTGRG
jgi:hypothetical protein